MRSPALAVAPTPGLPVRLAAHLFVASLLLYAGTSGGSLSSTDAVVTFEVTRGLVERGSVALPGNILGLDANRGLDGRYYSQYGIGQSIYNIPFYLAGRTVQRVTGVHVGKDDSLTKAAVALGSAVAAAGTVATMFVLAWMISGDARASVVAAIACAVGSLLWPYARVGFNAPLAAWILTGATACLYAGVARQRPRLILLAGILVGAGCLTRHEFALTAVPFIAWLAVARPLPSPVTRAAPPPHRPRDEASTPPAGTAGQATSTSATPQSTGTPSSAQPSKQSSRRPLTPDVTVRGVPFMRRLLLFLPGLIAGLGLWAIYNVSRFGNPWFVGYGPWYSTAGYYGLLFSPSGSVFVYSPAIILGLIGLIAIARRDIGLRAAWLLAMPAVVLFLFYGALDDWAGGRSYGPRYLVPLLPLLAVPIATLFAGASRPRRRVIVAVIVVSAMVQVPGVLVDYSRVSQSWAQTAAPDDLLQRRYRWSASPIWLDTEAALIAVPRTVAYLTGRETPPHVEVTASADRHDFSQQFAFSLDFWWLYLFYLRLVPAVVAWMLGLGFMLLPLIVMRRAWAIATRAGGTATNG
jgi:hypothetical protein